MRYLGIDVHITTTVWCLLDEHGEIVDRGKIPTSFEGFNSLVTKIGGPDQLVAGQEVGKMATFVYDVMTKLNVELKSFNAYHLRMIASSRKKTDKRDAFWIAKALQTGMTPHPVYIPTGQVRQLRRLLSRRAALVCERNAWLVRARSYLQAEGNSPKGGRTVSALMTVAMADPLGMNSELHEAVELCERMEKAIRDELAVLEKTLLEKAKMIDDVQRLTTIPAVGIKVATVIYAWVGDVTRFPDARALASYAGLVPSVHQSGASSYNGHITKQGSSELRRVLAQAGHVLLWRCQNADSIPLKRIAERVHTSRGRRKIAVVAAARHILRLAYYILRDRTTYDPSRLAPPTEEVADAA
ncbi:MAG: hypothetical protein A2289_06515 [Deltaproteobacteria bacterium RIFOXYA12_FULL_58_15]|nr:MAG: hypothetical protein A2289_06515 [Deltaproteobacteria bacterium RIFOXYA12_FULL_58_15]